jgi:hypothetical protein
MAGDQRTAMLALVPDGAAELAFPRYHSITLTSKHSISAEQWLGLQQPAFLLFMPRKVVTEGVQRNMNLIPLPLQRQRR